jgi:hypothetical protein
MNNNQHFNSAVPWNELSTQSNAFLYSSTRMSHAARLLISYQLCVESLLRGPALQDEIAGNLFCEKVHHERARSNPRDRTLFKLENEKCYHISRIRNPGTNLLVIGLVFGVWATSMPEINEFWWWSSTWCVLSRGLFFDGVQCELSCESGLLGN